MRNFSTSVNVIATPAHVWEILTNVERWAEWTPSVRRIERLDAAPLRVGSGVRIEQPKLRPATWTVTEWQPEVAFTWVSRSPGLVAVAKHTIEHAAEGSRVTLTVQFDGLIAPVVGLLTGSLTSKYLGLEAAGLKARCEGAN